MSGIIAPHPATRPGGAMGHLPDARGRRAGHDHDMAQETFQLSAEVAEVYEARFVPAFFAQWATRLLEVAEVTVGQRVLDVACGTGILARTAAERVGPAGSVVGVDLSDAMLTVARRVRPDLDWRQGDAAALPCGDGEFDVVASQMALMFFPDPDAAVREMRRAARPDGTVAVLVPATLAANPAYELFVDVVTRHAGPDARNLVTTYFALGDRDALAGLIGGAGLRVIRAEPTVGQMGFGSIDELVTVEIDSTPLGERLDPSARERILADCRPLFAPWQGADGTLRFDFESTVVVARR
jgi:ubiquinone/menaquinone biosynthesis C-methylase UbiE